MAEKKIDINAKTLTANDTSTKDYKTKVIFNDVKSNLIKNKNYKTNKFDTRLKVTVTGLGETSVPTDGLFKRISDLFTHIDNIEFFSTGKVLLTFTNEATDDITLEMEFVNVLDDQFNPLDQLQFNSIKVLSSEYSAVESITFENLFNRFFDNSVNSTDDFCQICPDDDQTATFTKVVKDDIFSEELLFNTLSKLFIEVSEVNDHIQINLGVTLESQSINEELIELNALKQINEEINNNTLVSKIVNSNKEESVTPTVEILSKIIGQNNLENIMDVSDEEPLFNTNKKLFSEKESTVNDLFIKEWIANRSLSHQTGQSDLIIKQINKNTEELNNFIDLLSIEFDKEFLTDQSTIIDEIDFESNIDRLFENIVFQTDSGLINNQNYFSEDYVIPGYVGTNTNI
jgi:hypothetical protein